MRIGELAETAGVSTRTVRHYHRIGLLPEPARHANDYRDYGLRDLLRLTRIRRLVELGLSLDEARDALADDEGRELREILTELDADLARQEQLLHRRRQRLAELLERPEKMPLTADDAVSEEVAGLLAEIGTRFPESSTARKDREYLALMDGSEGSEEVVTAFRDALADPQQSERIAELYRRFDELADAATDDPRIGRLAEEMFEMLPAGIRAGLEQQEASTAPIVTELLDDLTPAQAEVTRRIILRGERDS